MSIFDRRPEGYTDEEFAARGEHAERLLKDEVFRSIMEDAELSMLLNWLETDGSDVQARERAWMGINSLVIFEKELQKVINDGAVARTRLLQEQ